MRSRPVQTAAEVETLRLIRNSCREFMTRDRSEITPNQQARWFEHFGGLVLLFSHSGIDVGYGLVRREGGKGWVSGGLLPEWRGKGMGAHIFKRLCSAVGGEDAWLEVLSTNHRAIKLYLDLGFLKEWEKGGVLTMRLQR